MEGGDGNEYGGVVDCSPDDSTHRAFDMAVMVNVGIVKRYLASAAETGCRVGFALHKDVDKLVAEVLIPSAFRKIETGISDFNEKAMVVLGLNGLGCAGCSTT